MRFQTTLVALLPVLASATAPPTYEGLQVIFKDDFWGDAGSAPDLSKWRITTGDLNVNNEKETYSASNSNLQISGGGTVQLIPLQDSSAANGWTSARIETSDSVTPQPGKVTRVEASIRMGNGDPSTKQGIWPAFWMLGESMRHGTQWPLCGELDILEQRNGDTTVLGTAHCDQVTGGLCNEPIGRGSNVQLANDNSFHTWTVEWDRTNGDWNQELIKWSFDGNVYYTLSGGQLGDQNTWSILAHSPYYIILNVAVGGAFPGDPNGATKGGYESMMEVAYVAVYES